MAILGSQPAWARRETLFTDGFAAAAYGDLMFDRGAFAGENLSLLRIKAGVQIVRAGPVALSLGYQKSGFYTAQHNWDRKEGSLRVDYRGPVLELHLFPSAPLHLSLAASTNQGFLFRREVDSSLYQPAGCENCDIVLERSRLNLAEFSAQVGIRVASELYLSLGAGQRQIKATPAYEVRSPDGASPSFYEADQSEESSEENFFFVGIRGSQL